MAVEPRRYQFGPLEQRGLILGLRGGQVGVLAGAAIVAVGLIRSGQEVGLLLALAVVAAATAAAFVPVRGATIEQWAPTLLHWGAGNRRRRWLAALGPGTTRTPRCRATAGLDGLSIADVAAAGQEGPMAIIHDSHAGTFSAVLEVRGGAFALLDVSDKERRLASWSTVLASFGRPGSVVSGIQWVERTFPAGSSRLPVPPARAADAPGAAPRGCVESYAELVKEAGPVTQDHEILLVVTVSARAVARGSRRLATGGDAAAVVVGREVRLLQGQLRTADLVVERVLSADACRRAMRKSFTERPECPGAAGPWPWPVATEASWASYRTDGVWHATYWISDWPRIDVGPDFLAPLLLQSSGRRTVAVTMTPTDPLEAVRAVEAAKTADAADGELRRQAGFLSSARRSRETEHVLRREAELAEGHAEYRYAGFVTVTGSDLDELERSCAEVEQLAHQAHLDLRRMYGRQDVAFSWTLPIGRRLP